jgi:hypothetical protein
MRVECDRFDRWASLYRDNRLPGRARTAVERHLTLCPVCGARFAAYTTVLDRTRPPEVRSSLILADVTHELPPRPEPAEEGRPARAALTLTVWIFGLAVLASLLLSAYVLGYRAGFQNQRATSPAAAELGPPAPAPGASRE